MVRNSYAGLLEDWKITLIRRRARRRGFTSQDLDDAVQEIAIAFLRFRFDEARSNGAAEETVLTAIVDRQLAMIWRKQSRARRREEDAASQRASSYWLESKTELVDAVRAAVAELPLADRRVCRLLIDGRSINEIAESIGVSWHTAEAAIERIRRYFVGRGLVQFVEHQQEAAA